ACRRLGQTQCGAGGDLLAVGEAADTVGAEQSGHRESTFRGGPAHRGAVGRTRPRIPGATALPREDDATTRAAPTTWEPPWSVLRGCAPISACCTAAPCGPSSDRPSCAPGRGRHG